MSEKGSKFPEITLQRENALIEQHLRVIKALEDAQKSGDSHVLLKGTILFDSIAKELAIGGYYVKVSTQADNIYSYIDFGESTKGEYVKNSKSEF